MLRPIYRWKMTGIHWNGGWMSLSADSDDMENVVKRTVLFPTGKKNL
jgi:hypothetical protein